MKEEQSDTFELSGKTYSTDSSDNFFLAGNSHFSNNPADSAEQIRHLNDYDSNILQDGAYKDVNDDAFKIEYRISKTEEEIKYTENLLNAAKEIKDFDKVQELQAKLILLKNDYASLLSLYNDMALSAKITGTVSDIYKSSFGYLTKAAKNTLLNLYNMIISKLPAKFSSAIRIKQSLTILKNINKSVDNLVSMKMPYGENIDRYQKLSKYIIKANSIHAEISGYIKNNA